MKNCPEAMLPDPGSLYVAGLLLNLFLSLAPGALIHHSSTTLGLSAACWLGRDTSQSVPHTRFRILMTTSVFPRWEGDATPPFVENLAASLVEEGMTVRVLAPYAVGASRRETVRGVEVVRFPYGFPPTVQKLCYDGGMLINLRVRPWTRLLLPSFLVAQQWALFREIRDFHPTLLHSHSLLPQGLVTAGAAQRFNLPHVTTSHGNDVFGLKATGLMGRLKRQVLNRADAVTVNSAATREAVLALGCDPEKVHLIPAMPNSAQIDSALVERLCRDWNGRRTILFAGRLIEEKGVGDLIEAVRRLVRDVPELQLVILGEGADRPRFEAQAQDAGVADRTRFVGWIPGDQVVSWMAAADVVAVPSKPSPEGWTEAQGLVAVEAMAAGTPVVVSRFGGLAELDEQEGSVRKFVPGDCAELAKAIEQALNCLVRSSDRSTLSSSAPAYGKKVVVDRLGKLYGSLVAHAELNEANGELGES